MKKKDQEKKGWDGEMVLYYFMILWQVRLGFLDRKKIMLGFDCSNYFGFKRPYFRGSVHRKNPV